MKECSHFENLLSGYALGELHEQDRQRVDKHLAECSECLDILSNMQNVLSISDSMKAETASEKMYHFAAENIQVKKEVSKHISWSKIMKSNITKSAAAAIIMIAALSVLTIFNNTVSKAYALEDTIEAYNSIQWLHVYVSDILSPEETWTSEVWIQCDSQGNPTRIRHQANTIGSMGPLKITNNFNKSDVLLPKQNLRILGHQIPESLLPYNTSELDPKLLIETLFEQQQQGLVIVDIDQPPEKAEPITVTVTYPQGSRSETVKKVFYIDQATNLVTQIDKFNLLKDQQWQLYQSREFFDYNQPIDDKMFSLDDEIPATVKTVDMTGVEIGLDQGDMTEEEVTVELIRQFFEATIAKDYAKAGQLYLGAPDFLVEQQFMGANMVKILSLGPVQRDTDPDSNTLTSSCKVLAEFAGEYYEVDASMVRVMEVSDHPGKWMICGTYITTKPASGSLTLSQDRANLREVTYDGLIPGEFMHKWLLLEPMRIEVHGDTLFPSDETQKIAFDEDLINVSGFEPVVSIDGKNYRWSLLENDYGVIDLGKVDENWYLITYAMAQIQMPEETQAVLGIGSDDGVKVWLNGELVHKNWTTRGVEIDDDRVPVIFKKGMNQLVLKIQNGGGPWGFCCRRIDE